MKNDDKKKKQQFKDEKIEQDLVSELQRLRLENEYLKKLIALI